MDKKSSHQSFSSPQAQQPLGSREPQDNPPGDAARQGAPQQPSISGMINRTIAHWYVAVIVMILGTALTAVVVKTRKPVYRSETVIFYREGVRSTYLGPDGPDPLRTL